MARLYITYSSRDRALALQLAAQLRAYGHQIAIDVDSLVPGIEWRRELMDKLLLCDGVVVLLTANAVGSPFVFSEIGSARASSRRFLIPVIVERRPGVRVHESSGPSRSVKRSCRYRRAVA